jgi:DNA processing protein
VVGSRAATVEARRSAELVARRAAGLGVCVASGLARGVDAVAHRTALDADGESIAVLGTGVDRVYPEEHAALYAALVARGTIVSPHPPGTPPVRWAFPARNQVLAALASDVVLIQAERASGTRSTIEHALALGRRVWVMAGPLGDDAFAGNARWLSRAREDARITLLLDPAEPVASALAAATPATPATSAARADANAPPRERALRALETAPRALESIAAAAGLSTAAAAAALVELELAGIAERLPGPRFRRRTP